MSAELPDMLIPDFFTHDSALQMEGNPLRSLPVCEFLYVLIILCIESLLNTCKHLTERASLHFKVITETDQCVCV